MQLAHDSLGGQLGTKKILEQISRHFYWPSIRKDVQTFFCRSCCACQVVGKPGGAPTVAPLQPLPVEQKPFSQFMIDCVGHLPKSKRGNEYLLTILDIATRYLEAIPLRRIRAKTIVDHLVKFFSWAGLSRTIQSDRGSNFTFKLYQQVENSTKVFICLPSAVAAH